MVQDPSPNEPEGRLLMVNKRLTKAISAVPRARFQKARPKLPSCKRNDSGSTTPVSLKSTAVESVEFNSAKEKLKSSEDILPLKSESEEKCKPTQNDNLASKILETTKINLDVPKAFGANEETSKALDASDFNKNIPKEHVTHDPNQRISKAIDDANSIAKHTESVELIEAFIRSAVVEGVGCNSAKEKFKSTEDILPLKSESEEKCKPTQNNKLESKILETTQNNLDVPKAFDANHETPKALDASDFNENISKEHIARNPNQNIFKATDDADTITRHTENLQPTETSNSLPITPTAEERNDVSSSVTSTAAIDRASKYPHLTSILSKKRTEPKKDTTHKRRRKYWKGDAAPERDKMTMADLIYWNPTSSDPGLKKITSVSESASNSNDNIPEESHEVDEPEDQDEVCSSVPKLVISEDGQINIDQVSLVVARKQLPEPPINQVMRNEETTYSSFRKRPLTKQWTPKDTFIFYKALSLVGTDFALMEKLLPHRTRRELKLKFKREEKYNIDLVNKAMYESQPTFDGKDLEEHIENLNSVSEDFDFDCMQENNQPLVKEKKPRGRKRKEASKVLLEDGEQCLSPAQSVNNAEKKPRGRKRKEASKVLLEDGEQCLSPTQSVNDYGNKKPFNRKRKVARVLSDDSEPHFSPIKSLNGAGTNKITYENKVRNKRKRKARKLPEGFINIDDIEDITELIMNSANENDSVSEPSSPEANHLDNSDLVETHSEISVPSEESSLDQICEGSTNIQIICLEEGSNEESSNLVDDSINQLEMQPEASAFSKKSTNIQIIYLNEDSIEESRLGGDSNNLLETSTPSGESNEFQIVCIDDTGRRSSLDGETVLVTDNASSIVLPHHIQEALEHPRSTSLTSVNQNECVIDLVADTTDSNEITSFTHVMANEVVTSIEPATKRKRKINTIVQKYKKAKVVPKIHRKMNETKESSQQLQPSSFNYTPLEDSLLADCRLEFSPKSNSRTYSNSSKSPSVCESTLINSLQKPLLTSEHSNTLLTSMSMSKNSQSIAIPLTPEHSNSLLSSLNASESQSLAIPLAPDSNPNAPSDSVLFLTKSQNTDNVIHLFMYKNAST